MALRAAWRHGHCSPSGRAVCMTQWRGMAGQAPSIADTEDNLYYGSGRDRRVKGGERIDDVGESRSRNSWA